MIGVIKGTGAYVPDKVLDNDDIAKLVDTSDEWIRERTGIVKRHIATCETTTEMAAEAAQMALLEAGVDADELDPECFSINDKLAEIKANPKAGAIIDEMMAKGASDRGDVADAVKDNPGLQRMMGRMTLISLLKQSGADDESIKQVNRILQ